METKHRGKQMNNSIKYSVCSEHFSYGGLFGIWARMTAYIIRAYEKGYVPIIDLKHAGNKYFKDGRALKDNAWEYFFAQPGGVRLEDLGENSVIVFNNDEEKLPPGYILEAYDIPSVKNSKAKEHKYLREYQKQFKLSDEMQKYLEEEYHNIIGDEQEILGILCRGTDYVNKRPYRHAIQPQIEEVIKKAKQLKDRYHYNKI